MSPATAHRDTALDEARFAEFYERTADGLWRYLRGFAGDEATADDVLQESYVKLLGLRSPPDEERRTAYLYRIATNLVRDRWRRRQTEERFADRVFPRRFTEPGPQVEHRLDLDAALAVLKERDRALVWLAYVEGYDHKEIAEVLDLNAASVRVLLFRARKKLAAFLDKNGIGALENARRQSS